MYVIMGATGNIGSKLANVLLDKDEKVKVIGRSAERLKPFVDHGAEAAVGDAFDVVDTGDGVTLQKQGEESFLILLLVLPLSHGWDCSPRGNHGHDVSEQ